MTVMQEEIFGPILPVRRYAGGIDAGRSEVSVTSRAVAVGREQFERQSLECVAGKQRYI